MKIINTEIMGNLHNWLVILLIAAVWEAAFHVIDTHFQKGIK